MLDSCSERTLSDSCVSSLGRRHLHLRGCHSERSAVRARRLSSSRGQHGNLCHRRCHHSHHSAEGGCVPAGHPRPAAGPRLLAGHHGGQQKLCDPLPTASRLHGGFSSLCKPRECCQPPFPYSPHTSLLPVWILCREPSFDSCQKGDNRLFHPTGI